jgi:heme exporter protein C
MKMTIIFKLTLFFWMVVSLTGAFIHSHGVMGLGDLSRIIYFHIPTAWIAVLAYGVAMVQAFLYLRHRRLINDAKAVAAAELGTLFALLATVTGAIFARATWGLYWNWDPRQTTIFLLFLIYIAYFSLRSVLDEVHQRARLSAVYAIMAFITVPFLVFIVPRAYPTLHPTPMINPGGKIAMNGQMVVIFGAHLVGFTALFAWIYWLRWGLELIKRGKD